MVGHTDCNLFHLDLYHWWFQQILQETHLSCWQNPKSSISTIWSNPFILLEKPKKPNQYIMPKPIYLVGETQEPNKHIKNQLLHGTITNLLLHGTIKSPLLHDTIRSLFVHGTTKSPLLPWYHQKLIATWHHLLLPKETPSNIYQSPGLHLTISIKAQILFLTISY